MLNEHVLHVIETTFAIRRMLPVYGNDDDREWQVGSLLRHRGLTIIDAGLLNIRTLHDFLYKDQAFEGRSTTASAGTGSGQPVSHPVVKRGDVLALDFVRDGQAWLDELRPPYDTLFVRTPLSGDSAGLQVPLRDLKRRIDGALAHLSWARVRRLPGGHDAGTLTQTWDYDALVEALTAPIEAFLRECRSDLRSGFVEHARACIVGTPTEEDIEELSWDLSTAETRRLAPPMG
jgi:hypothetical protein